MIETARTTRTVLHFSPHPDDELIGAPATLMALRDAGWRVVNLACGLGRAEQRSRREAELRDACRRAGFELVVPERPVEMSGADDRRRAAVELIEIVGGALDELRPEVVVSPSPEDLHPAHELVAGAVRTALAEQEDVAPPWWMWAMWGSLRQPTLATGFDRSRLDEVLSALAAHAGELRRNDYGRLLTGRAIASSVLAPELLAGFGAEVPDGPPYAELLTEAIRSGGSWRLGRPRWLDPEAPLDGRTGGDALVG